MDVSLLKTSHEELFLDQGRLLALGFFEGWACFRITHREWSNLKPWSLGTAVAAGANLAAWDEVQDALARHYLEPHSQLLIYHSFWGVTPVRARIYTQYPPRSEIGSVLAVPRTIFGDVGYIDGEKSPFDGPYSIATEMITVKEKYPQYQAHNPLGEVMDNILLNFDQMHYMYNIIKDKDLIKSILIGSASRVKKYTMGPAWPNATTIPDWLKKAVGEDILKYSLTVMAEGGA